MITIDLNSDLGEQEDASLDERIMPFISSCNIACGGHAGDEASVKRTIDLAIKNNVAIGAHPGFPDRENFGREVMKIAPEKLIKSLKEQILLVKSMAEKAGKKLHHVKPHGALYNLAATDRATSALIGQVLLSINPVPKWYGLSHSVTEEVALELNIPFVGEGFADRRYEENRTLRSRKFEDAVLHEEQEVLDQVEKLAIEKKVNTVSEPQVIIAQTICLHSDTKGAVNLAKSIHDHLVNKGVSICSV
ncbi:MAG: 5-oxoprolinase subunit PxpA [Cyclobacteriaceae bacterium]